MTIYSQLLLGSNIISRQINGVHNGVPDDSCDLAISTIGSLTFHIGIECVSKGAFVNVHETALFNCLSSINKVGNIVLRFRFFKRRFRSAHCGDVTSRWLYWCVWQNCSASQHRTCSGLSTSKTMLEASKRVTAAIFDITKGLYGVFKNVSWCWKVRSRSGDHRTSMSAKKKEKRWWYQTVAGNNWDGMTTANPCPRLKQN